MDHPLMKAYSVDLREKIAGGRYLWVTRKSVGPGEEYIRET
jgi:hypothetical protein